MRGRLIGFLAAAVAVAVLVPLVVGLTSSTAPVAAAVRDPAAAAAATAQRMAAEGVVDVPVRFTVEHRNTTAAPCATAPGTYEVTGHLTRPATPVDRVTLYLHDLDAGEWYWRTDVPGYHHAEEMARRGLASLTIDRPGHGTSGGLNGYQMCVGAQADVALQIADQLRTGDYGFSSVVLAGHGSGAQIAQLAAMTGRVDGLVVMGWADAGRTERFMTGVFANLSTCMQQVGPDQTPDAEGGYAYFDVGPARFRDTNFADTDPEVLAAAVPQQQPHACKEVASLFEGISVDLRGLGAVTVPVLGVYGADDALFQGGPEHVDLFGAAPRTDVVVVPGAGHYVGLERGAAQVHDALAAWLAVR